MELYKRIRQRREELGISQEELAKLLGYKSRSTIAKIEKGENDITQSKIIAFAKALKTTPRDLMGWNDCDASDIMICTDENKDAIHKSGRSGHSTRHNPKVNDLIKSNQLIDTTLADDQGYYADPEVAALAEELRTDPNRRILFDATKNLSKDDIDIVLNLINGLKAKEGKK